MARSQFPSRRAFPARQPQWLSPTPKPFTSTRSPGLEGGVGGLDHLPCPVDARDHGELADDRGLAGDGERVLVVDGGALDPDQDVSRGKRRLLHLRHADGLPGLALLDEDRSEHGDLQLGGDSL